MAELLPLIKLQARLVPQRCSEPFRLLDVAALETGTMPEPDRQRLLDHMDQCYACGQFLAARVLSCVRT